MLLMSIVGKVKDLSAAKEIVAILKSAGMVDVEAQTCPSFDEWLAGLPSEPIEGLADKCRGWVRQWGSGGGDFSTECCLMDAISEAGTDSPKELADALYDSIAGYSKTSFEARVLVMDIINGCMEKEGPGNECAGDAC